MISLDPDDRWAIVGEPGRRFGWILSRSHCLDPSSLQRIDAILEGKGDVPGEFQFAATRPSP